MRTIVRVVAFSAFICSFSSVAFAACHSPPPSRFEYEPVQPYSVQFVQRDVLVANCGYTTGAFSYAPIACAMIDTNVIYILDADWTDRELECLLVHEKAHLNGWGFFHER